MAGIQRFITYIYAYEDGEKMNNAGYAKIETRGSEGRVEIHFINGGVSGTGKVAFLLVQDEKIAEVPLGEIRVEGGRGIGRFAFQTETVKDTAIPFDRIDGIGVTDSNRQKYMSFWKDVDISKIPATTYNEEIEQSKEVEIPEEAELEWLHTMEIPMKNVFPVYGLEEIWQAMKKGRDCIKIGRNVCALQIELSDLRELPKKYWYLGNNSFLLHGFFNYRHLLFGRLPNESWFLGVPGIYERQERVMASIFGFSGFLPMVESAPKTDVPEGMIQEEAVQGQQGIWYHVLEE